MQVESKVGSKGELFIPKNIRDQLGLKPYRKVRFRVENSVLVVEPVPDLLTILNRPSKAKISLETLEKERQELSRRAEG